MSQCYPDIVGVLQSVHSALDEALGDTDVSHIENDDELREEHPVQWAAFWLAHVIEELPALLQPARLSAGSAELLGNLPLQYIDGPDFCTVKDATGGDFALTVQPELMQMMEKALLCAAQPSAERVAELQYEAGMYKSLYENAIEQCATVAEGFDAACNSPRMKLFEEAGLVLAIYKRDGEIGAAIRALKDYPALTFPDREGK